MAFPSFLVSLLASAVGAICGIGGGVIIKPVLDMLGVASVSTISFLSGCTVLVMSGYSVIRSIIAHDNHVDFVTGTPLAIGAAAGGILGKQLFTAIRDASTHPDAVGRIQALCLLVVTLGTMLFTIYKKRIHTHRLHSPFACILIGFSLGVLSSFLGIGGGPINLVVLYFFFGLDTKTAAQNSLYIILFSQLTSLMTTLLTRTVPAFDLLTLVLMVAGGIGGGMLGRIFNKRMNNIAVEYLFIAAMVVIIIICFYNALPSKA